MVSRADMHATAELPVANAGRLSRLDVAFGTCLGRESRPPLPAPRAGVGAREAMRATLRRLLERGPCYVAFTGGRDSATILAVAADVARRDGLPLPVPITVRYPDFPEAEDHAWAERVVGHLRLDDWLQPTVRDELDVLGPYARRALEGVGPMFPSTVYTLMPALEAGRDGVVAVGVGGADFFSFWRWHPLAAILAGQRRPRRSDLPLAALAILPARLRRRPMARAAAASLPPWLRPEVAAEARRVIGEQFSAVPRRFDRAVATQHTHRCFAATTTSVDGVAAVAGARVALPLIEPEVLASLSAAGGWLARGGRTGLFELIAGDLLPPGTLAPRRGASMGRVLEAGGGRRRFAQTWDGRGADADLVDPERLRASWAAERADVRGGIPLAAAWLASQAGA